MLYSLHGQSKDALAKRRLGEWEYDIIYLAYKCNMTDIVASFGLSQISRCDQQIKRRHELIKIYDEALLPLGIQSIEHSGYDFASNRHLYLTRIHGIDKTLRNKIIFK